MDIGVRELRDGLSRHLASVREGHTVTVTDHGRPVARIIPATLRRRTRRAPINTQGSVSDLVDQQRR